MFAPQVDRAGSQSAQHSTVKYAAAENVKKQFEQIEKGFHLIGIAQKKNDDRQIGQPIKQMAAYQNANGCNQQGHNHIVVVQPPPFCHTTGKPSGYKQTHGGQNGVSSDLYA